MKDRESEAAPWQPGTLPSHYTSNWFWRAATLPIPQSLPCALAHFPSCTWFSNSVLWGIKPKNITTVPLCCEQKWEEFMLYYAIWPKKRSIICTVSYWQRCVLESSPAVKAVKLYVWVLRGGILEGLRPHMGRSEVSTATLCATAFF